MKLGPPPDLEERRVSEPSGIPASQSKRDEAQDALLRPGSSWALSTGLLDPTQPSGSPCPPLRFTNKALEFDGEREAFASRGWWKGMVFTWAQDSILLK